MSKILAMFPGQGSQHVGMGRDLFDQFDVASKTFQEASDAIGVDIKLLRLAGPEAELTMTANTQPCILRVSVATWRVLQAEVGFEPEGFAGHSLGEYSAAVAAEKIDFARAVTLVRK